MATFTVVQLADVLLEHIGAKAAGQAASAEDAIKAAEVIGMVKSELERDDVARWADDAIPDWAALAVRDVAAFEMRNTFGLSGERLNDVVAAYGPALRKLYRFTGGRRDPRIAMRTDYF
jgi:hypothetical protein